VKEIISIGERTFGHPEKKKSWRLNFSIRERNNLYWRKNEKKKSWRLNFSIGERNNLYSRKNFFLSAKELLAILRKKKAGDG